ncbi:hypothetical protein EVAR_45697_1 [Eumeta japonica]|uniref:Uncharacterized protein n=1 Tax=Eumeta variegata TaxID=151549 RepID=A0A4C1XI13_EUMVA|nr:hypothetical protein EVAR_45697_1 [Eumeta japonica]
MASRVTSAAAAGRAAFGSLPPPSLSCQTRNYETRGKGENCEFILAAIVFVPNYKKKQFPPALRPGNDVVP